jgi:hypothetical protein
LNGSCGAARGAFIEPVARCASATGFALASGWSSRFSGGVAFLPCFLTLSSAPSGLCHSGYSDSGGGAGETSPAARSAARDFFAILRLPGGDIRSGSLERSCGAARGTIIETTPAAPTATGITRAIGMTIAVFGWCCVLPTFFRPFFWFRRRAGRRAGTPVPVVFRKCRSIRAAAWPAEAKEEEQRQTGLVRAQAARQGDSGAIARAGRIAKHGNGQAEAPAVPAPTSAPATGTAHRVRRNPRPRDPRQRACRTPFAESSRRAAGRPGRRGG